MDIKNLPEHDRTELYTIGQEIFDKGYIPEDWTDSFLRHTPKPGKGHHKLNEHCILTMQNTIGKLMEHTVARKLIRDLEDREIHPANQGGSDQENAYGKMQLHLHMTCMKDSRGKNKQ